MELILHPKWQDAVSKQDLDLFEGVLESATFLDNKICFLSAKVARNYRNDLLATVLIANRTDESFSVDQLVLHYEEGGEVIATNTFSIPSLIVEPNTVTPWTFIFPAATVQGEPQLHSWGIKETASA